MLENMRMNEGLLKNLDTEKMKSCIVKLPKKDSLKFLIKAIEKL